MLNLVDQAGLHRHDRRHHAHHAQEKRATPNTIDEGPRDERGCEEPSLKEAAHESRHVIGEANGILEERRGVVWKVSKRFLVSRELLTDNRVDATQLLESLDGTRNEETSAALDLILLQQVLPGTGSNGGLQGRSVHDISVKCSHLCRAGIVLVKSQKNLERLLRTVMACKPTRTLGDDQKNQSHGYEEDAL